MFPPERIVCLTEETVETLYLLGEEHRIVGISGYVVRPPHRVSRARRHEYWRRSTVGEMKEGPSSSAIRC